MFLSKDPFSNKIIQEIPFHSTEKQLSIQIKASEVFPLWKGKSFEQKTALFKTLAQLLRNNNLEIAIAMTREMGKPISESKAEIEK